MDLSQRAAGGTTTGNPQNIGRPNLVPQNNRLQGSGSSGGDTIAIPGQTSLPKISLGSVQPTSGTNKTAPQQSSSSGAIVFVLVIVAVLIGAMFLVRRSGILVTEE